MCGVIGLVHEHHRDDLGVIAAELLKTLEYRGYDSTGAAIQGANDEAVEVRKDVGAPSVMVKKLGIDRLGGHILCAQVRWATFGAVDKVNAQPHVVRCKTYIYGAHNGNVTNCDSLKAWLQSEGHTVLSDNDGEMVVHSVEHAFAARLEALPEGQRRDYEARRLAMRAAIVEAGKRLKGSYSAVIVDPVTHIVWAIKKGSSLYFGVGETHGDHFAIASSDLSSVLKLTRAVVPMAEGEVAEMERTSWRMFRLDDGAPLERRPVRSKLRAEDTELAAPFATFMEQEIHAQVETTRDVVRLFSGGSTAARRFGELLTGLGAAELATITGPLEKMRDEISDDAMRKELDLLMQLPAVRALLARIPADARLPEPPADEHTRQLEAASWAADLHSSERGLFQDLFAMSRTADERLLVRLLDAHLEREEVAEYEHAVRDFTARVVTAIDRGRTIFILCCGSSFHAAKTAALFFNELAEVEVVPLLPGEFRGQFGRAYRDGDVVIAVSQSGETKDLIDVLNQVIASGKKVDRISLVNNVNSTLAQEKSDVVIPLRCGPEIAVAATKSFINQLAVFYCLALEVAERRKKTPELARRREQLPELPALVAHTIQSTKGAVTQAAGLLYLAPSIHILATRLLGVAKEGALKIREVVLNHTEGFEASEFKHGPNTILGFNTIFGLGQVAKLLGELSAEVANVGKSAAADGASAATVAELLAARIASVLPGAGGASGEGVRALLDPEALKQALYADYPLVYVTGPDGRDVDLTVSQMNTHKIRGSSTIVIAEEDAALRVACTKPPADNPAYRSAYVLLPATGDHLMTAFSATVVLQRLALEMSMMKMAHLDALGMKEHGVHPDVPKNVSKSITVD